MSQNPQQVVIATTNAIAKEIETLFSYPAVIKGRNLNLTITDQQGIFNPYSLVTITSTAENGQFDLKDIFWIGRYSALGIDDNGNGVKLSSEWQIELEHLINTLTFKNDAITSNQQEITPEALVQKLQVLATKKP